MIRATGGAAKFVVKLDQVFDVRVAPAHFKNVEDITGLIGWYAHGNKPGHRIACRYDYAGAPWTTQQRLKQIIDRPYAPRPDGLSGNDDLGQMSAWDIFTALGFYPITPAGDVRAIGRPFVCRATIHSSNGRSFIVAASSLDNAHPWLGAVTLNGKPSDRTCLRHAEIPAAGERHSARSPR